VDFGDLIILLFIVTSILSSLVGGKKKQQAKKRPQARPRPRPVQLPQQRRVESAPAGGASTPAPPPRETETAQTMEDILRQLGLDVGPEPEPEFEPEPEPVPEPVVRDETPRLERDRVGREIPQVRSLEDNTAEVVADRAGPVHRQFHEQYVKPFEQTRIEEPRSRARIHLNPRSLREAVILKEILGPPKGMQ
jgi:hypothetical protein